MVGFPNLQRIDVDINTYTTENSDDELSENKVVRLQAKLLFFYLNVFYKILRWF